LRVEVVIDFCFVALVPEPVATVVVLVAAAVESVEVVVVLDLAVVDLLLDCPVELAPGPAAAVVELAATVVAPAAFAAGWRKIELVEQLVVRLEPFAALAVADFVVALLYNLRKNIFEACEPHTSNVPRDYNFILV
jgi:hypothetical protein